jgi:flagellar hook-associated protein 3 FlgL
MIDRISTFGLSQALLSQYQGIQTRMAQTQQQISSGKVGTQYADVKDQSGVLAAAKSKAGTIDSYTASVKTVVGRLDLYDTQLQGLSDLTAQLREAIGGALSSGSGTGFMEKVRALYEEAVNTLNTQVDGKYIYGGSRTDVPPVNAKSLDDLVAAPAVADVFDNTTLKQNDRLDDNETVQTGIDASELATNLFQMFKDIGTLDAGGSGPFGTTLDQAQFAFLSTQNAAVPAIQSGIDVAAAQNAAHYKQATNALDRHQSMADYFTKFISDIEDADLPTAIAKLNADQVAAAASGRMIASLNQLSLLNFLPVA